MAPNRVRFPRFFKVFLAETASESLAIPLSFTEQLRNPLPHTAKLRGTGGRVWTLSMNKVREGAYFTTGWSKFAEEHNLKSGEFLTFVYDCNRTFEVSVYGRSCCKEIRAVAQVVELSDSDSEEEEEEEDTIMEETDDEVGFSDDQEINQSVYPLEEEETETEIDTIGNSNLDGVANPCFDTNLKARIYELLIPAQTVKDHDLRFGETIKYIDGEGTLEGERGKWTDDRICFKGWDRICRRNRLKEKDTVTCELLHTRNKVHSVKVHVTRG
ncbi:hypothetical protein AALP_AA5G164400 [Arabis alpina]|uniref:TF-B3 domain-containing protein n=1 Tax=Arabis alpina TaxID=50452 RepID=A0A087GXH9_ARAAL|nr:hypothetical protein AALP_AA5G164400 [Arabis alpina]